MCPLFNDQYIEELYDSNRGVSKINVLKCYVNRIWQILKHGRRSNVIIIEKELLPYFPAWVEVSWSMLGVQYWVDIDDAIFHYYDDLKNPSLRVILHGKIDKVFEHSKLVLAGNEYLARRAKSAGAKKVIIFPTVIDFDKYESALTETSFTDKVVVGWIGSPGSVRFLERIVPTLDNLAEEIDFEFRVIGSNIVFNTKNLHIKYLDWSESKEIELVKQFDIGIMPLKDTPFEKGKCGYKIIQYFGCEKPVIASPVGVNQEIIDHGINGFLVSNNKEWKGYLKDLINDKEKRLRFGRAGFSKAKSNFGLKQNTNVMLKLLEERNKE